MKNKLIQFLWVGIGILLIGTGIFAIRNPSDTLLSIAMTLGVILLLTGIFHIVVYLSTQHLIYGSTWLLGEGIIDLLVSILLFRHAHLATTAIPFIFSMWAMFTGVSKLILSAEFRELGFRRWGIYTLPGVLCLVLGFLSFYDFMLAATVISTFVGLFFILQGIAAFLFWWLSRKITFE